ncbi:recombinase family protein [Nonomuraea sp. NPDC050540]|uniref:recombinase family protein n=1 Tax=Nonomuraea sp. NPDC050540 TaxID=3364367 RepID=UPI0037B308B8
MPRGGAIVAEFFDVDKSRLIPPLRRPEAATLIAELRNPHRGFDAVVVGQPRRAFYGNQFGNTMELFNHYGVPLWVPEVGGPIDPTNEAHEPIMLMFGGISKGGRNRIKMRVRTTMEAQAKIEWRFLGGRPPYGYRLKDIGPTPTRARRLTTPIVGRIFWEFVHGQWLYLIAEGLTREDIPCSSAYDKARDRHRSRVAWSKSAVRAILLNLLHGHQIWNRQRKQEELPDVNDVTQGHVTKLKRKPRRPVGLVGMRSSTSRSSTPRPSRRPRRCRRPTGVQPPSASLAGPRVATSYAACRTAASAPVGWKAPGTTAAPTTGASSHRIRPRQQDRIPTTVYVREDHILTEPSRPRTTR